MFFTDFKDEVIVLQIDEIVARQDLSNEQKIKVIKLIIEC